MNHEHIFLCYQCQKSLKQVFQEEIQKTKFYTETTLRKDKDYYGT